MHQAAVLLNHPDMGAQAVLGDFCHVLPVNQHLPAVGVVKPQDQFHERRFPRARAPDQPDFLPRCDCQVDPIQTTRGFAVMVAQVAQLDLSFVQA